MASAAILPEQIQSSTDDADLLGRQIPTQALCGAVNVYQCFQLCTPKQSLPASLVFSCVHSQFHCHVHPLCGMQEQACLWMWWLESLERHT